MDRWPRSRVDHTCGICSCAMIFSKSHSSSSLSLCSFGPYISASLSNLGPQSPKYSYSCCSSSVPKIEISYYQKSSKQPFRCGINSVCYSHKIIIQSFIVYQIIYIYQLIGFSYDLVSSDCFRTIILN